jgi:riboflavin synthase
MFTGIVQSIGEVRAVTPRGGDVELLIGAPGLDLTSVAIGDSISCSGLTVTRLEGDAFAADASLETLNVTTLGEWKVGQRINLEKALCAGQPLGGHYVTGHVDGIATVVDRINDARSIRVQFEAPAQLARYIARKGSVCIDGVSLTVNDVNGARFSVNLIPHTLEVTTLDGYRPGTRVNLEVDIIARYLERLNAPA